MTIILNHTTALTLSLTDYVYYKISWRHYQTLNPFSFTVEKRKKKNQKSAKENTFFCFNFVRLAAGVAGATVEVGLVLPDQPSPTSSPGSLTVAAASLHCRLTLLPSLLCSS